MILLRFVAKIVKCQISAIKAYMLTVYANRASCLPKKARQSDWENASRDTGAAFEQRG